MANSPQSADPVVSTARRIKLQKQSLLLNDVLLPAEPAAAQFLQHNES